jgi:hypothetical protein
MSEARRRALARLRRERPQEYRELVALIHESERRELKLHYENSFFGVCEAGLARNRCRAAVNCMLS